MARRLIWSQYRTDAVGRCSTRQFPALTKRRAKRLTLRAHRLREEEGEEEITTWRKIWTKRRLAQEPAIQSGHLQPDDLASSSVFLLNARRAPLCHPNFARRLAQTEHKLLLRADRTRPFVHYQPATASALKHLWYRTLRPDEKVCSRSSRCRICCLRRCAMQLRPG